MPENIQHSSHGNENHKTPTAATVEALGPDNGGLAGAEQPEQPEGRQREVPVVAALETIPPRDDVRGVAGGCGALTPASSAQKALHAKETRSMSTQSKKRLILLFYSRICRHFFYVKIDCGMGKPSGQSTSLVFFIIFQYSRFLFYMIDYILLFISNLAAEDAISELRCHEKGPWGGEKNLLPTNTDCCNPDCMPCVKNITFCGRDLSHKIQSEIAETGRSPCPEAPPGRLPHRPRCP